MRLLKITTMILIIFILGGLTIAASSCAEASTTAAPKTQAVAVQRGNLTVDITGVGNLALSQKDDLAFEIAGTVAEVLVEEGDTVEKGQVLAKLDTTDWEKQLSALEDKVTVAERQLTAKKRAVTNAERQLEIKKRAVTNAERQLEAKKRALIDAELQPEIKGRNVMAKERAVLQAEINLKDAQTALETTQVTYTVADFIAAQKAVDDAKAELDKAIKVLFQYVTGTEGYRIKQDLVVSAQARLKTAQAKFDNMLSGFAEELSKNKQLVDNAQWSLEDARITVADAQLAVANTQQAIADAQLAVADAQQAIADAQLAVADAQQDIADAQLAVEDAQKALADAQKALADAQSDHPEIIAPFAGFITKVSVVGGDEVTKGTVAVTLADPNKFEADILVNETDILKTRLGGTATVVVEAVPGLSLPAKVTAIAPTATISSGVVNFKVKVELESLQSVIQARQQMMSNLSSGNITSRQPTGGSPFSGNVTSPRRPIGSSPFSGNITSSGTISPRQGGTRSAQGQIPTTLLSDFQLREGQTVTVSILVAESNNVLLLPNGAITRQGGQSMVKVVNNGVIEQRSITVGISDYQYTEVTGGLSEGETVVVPQNTAPTTPATSQQGGQMRLPGMGGFGR